jgi:hypothetical protein
MKEFLTSIYKAKQTVFTSNEIALLAGEKGMDSLKAKLAYYVKTKKLIRLRRGIFAKDDGFDKNELAVRVFSPAYVSFETVLAKEGVIFQYYDSVFVASYLSRELSFGKNKIIYRKLKNEVLLSRQGVIDMGGYCVATKERAFLDTLYLFGDYYFDNLRELDWQLCFEMADIYKNKSLKKRLDKYYSKFHA